jgi:hypothetical protein
MNDNFTDEVKLKSTDVLRDIAVNFNMHRGALVAAAKKELDNRGIELSDEEKKIIEDKKNARKQDAVMSKSAFDRWDWFTVNWKINIVDDVNAPQLYSRKIINIFSIAFSVLFGGILLAINLKNVNNKKAILPVLTYSIIYTGLMIYILGMIPGSTTPLTIAFNAIGATVLYNTLWKKYIGKDFQYRTKSYWIPLIIGILVICFFIFIILANFGDIDPALRRTH